MSHLTRAWRQQGRKQEDESVVLGKVTQLPRCNPAPHGVCLMLLKGSLASHLSITYRIQSSGLRWAFKVLCNPLSQFLPFPSSSPAFLPSTTHTLGCLCAQHWTRRRGHHHTGGFLWSQNQAGFHLTRGGILGSLGACPCPESQQSALALSMALSHGSTLCVRSVLRLPL